MDKAKLLDYMLDHAIETKHSVTLTTGRLANNELMLIPRFDIIRREVLIEKSMDKVKLVSLIPTTELLIVELYDTTSKLMEHKAAIFYLDLDAESTYDFFYDSTSNGRTIGVAEDILTFAGYY